jgi:hypothetical protein
MIQTPGSALVGIMQARFTNAVVNLFSNTSLAAATLLGVGLLLILSIVFVVKRKRIVMGAGLGRAFQIN